jgi:hypothetical protein
MHGEAIDAKTKSVLEKIVKSEIAKKFYLAGGTALAIQMGHRKSIDFDFFSAEKFSVPILKKKLSKIGKFVLDYEEEQTLSGSLNGVKISFFHYNYKLLFPPVFFLGAKLADGRDIAAMKIDTVSARGNKKDFVDLYFLLNKYSLSELFDIFEKKYSGIKYNKLHILKSLVYFDDADRDPMPEMLEKESWEKIKDEIAERVKNFHGL